MLESHTICYARTSLYDHLQPHIECNLQISNHICYALILCCKLQQPQPFTQNIDFIFNNWIPTSLMVKPWPALAIVTCYIGLILNGAWIPIY